MEFWSILGGGGSQIGVLVNFEWGGGLYTVCSRTDQTIIICRSVPTPLDVLAPLSGIPMGKPLRKLHEKFFGDWGPIWRCAL